MIKKDWSYLTRREFYIARFICEDRLTATPSDSIPLGNYDYKETKWRFVLPTEGLRKHNYYFAETDFRLGTEDSHGRQSEQFGRQYRQEELSSKNQRVRR